MGDCHTFRQELQETYPTHGHALWEPDPGGLYNAVEVGDVGFIRDGYFYRLFNALLSNEHPYNQFPHPVAPYPLQLVPKVHNHIRKSRDNQRDFCSESVARADRYHHDSIVNADRGRSFISFNHSGKCGALISLPFGAQREDTVALGDFSDWIVENVHRCVKIAEDHGSGVKRMEDIVLVTGRHLAQSWIYATFPAMHPRALAVTMTVQVRMSKTSTVHLSEWDVNDGNLKLGPSGEDLPETQCVFVRGYRVVRAQDSASGLQGMGLRAVTVGGPSDPETGPLNASIPSNALQRRHSRASALSGEEEDEEDGEDEEEFNASFPSTHSAHISNSKWHASGQQQNYLRKRRKQLSVLGQGHGSLDTDDDVSKMDNEECENDFGESENDNGPPSPETMSKRSFSTQSMDDQHSE